MSLGTFMKVKKPFDLAKYCRNLADAYRRKSDDTVYTNLSCFGICHCIICGPGRAKAKKLVNAIKKLENFDDIGFKWPRDIESDGHILRARFLEKFARKLRKEALKPTKNKGK